jgi:hypothetical protein
MECAGGFTLFIMQYFYKGEFMKLVYNLSLMVLFAYGMSQAYVAMELFQKLDGVVKYAIFFSIVMFVPMFFVLNKEITKKTRVKKLSVNKREQ